MTMKILRSIAFCAIVMIGKEIMPCAPPDKEKIKTMPSKNSREIEEFLLSALTPSYFYWLPTELRLTLIKLLQKARKLKPINKSPIKQSFGPPQNE